MPNNLFQQLNQNHSSQNSINPISGKLDSIKQLANMVQSNANPMQMLQMIGNQNPQIGQMMQMMNGSNMTPKQMFMQVAQQKGIDPNQIIQMLK